MASQPQSKNPLLRLAQPLFWLLDELSPELESAARLDALKSEVRTRLAAFKQAAQAAALKADSVEAVHYCFCAALDQAGSRVRGRADGLRGVWLHHGLLMQLYGEKDFGQRCRSWITKLQETPNASENALGVIAQLMERGLRDERGMPLPKIQLVHQWSPVEVIPSAATTPQRRHVTIANSAAEHQRIHVAVSNPSGGAVEPSDVLITVGMPVQEAAPSQELSPQRSWRLIVIAVVVTALVIGLAWVTYRQHLDNQALASQVSALEAQVAKRQEPLEDRIARALTSETGASQFGLSTEGDRIYIVFSSGMGFAAGSADITPMLARQLERLAGVLTTDGKVTIVGHTDDSPGARGRTETNLALSAARAMAVGRNLQAHGLSETRLSTMGRGAKEPVGDNKTAEGRALNRRVEIVLDRQRASVPERASPTTAGD
ncbi:MULTISPECIES: OmpA family protein [Ralstonia]|jgi:type VI secretion system protein ImpK|uniref:Peptidoglycan-associated lipoprotein n=3 Tax=Burkholderiaceae TaxID=119060 RepID=A0ABN9HYW3_RALPI|nr:MULTISPECIES: OmpA family protein [Ralstonia]CAJ0723832.1 Peptidoglycan-associated lipoprotein [Ralstonia pickettii]